MICLVGGGNVFINAKAKHYVYNDIDTHVCDLLYNMYKYGEKSVEYIDNIISEYNLTKENKDGYLKLREDYNKSKDKPFYLFYALICYSFNNQIRFNSNGEFNMPFGKDRSSFNTTLRNIFLKYCNALQNITDMKFESADFRQYDVSCFEQNDFVYCDPPYLITCAAYNDCWNEDIEKQLFDFLDNLNANNIKFGLSNVFDNKGKENTLLKTWEKQGGYEVNHLKHNYGNCNYHSFNKNSDTTDDEVYICNYKIDKNAAFDMDNDPKLF